MKRVIAAIVACALMVGCSATYHAKAPGDVFVTKGDAPGPYTPIACVEAEKLNFYFLGLGFLPVGAPAPEDQLDDVVNSMLVNKARDVGANAVIRLEYETRVPVFPWMWYYERANGMAVRMGQ